MTKTKLFSSLCRQSQRQHPLYTRKTLKPLKQDERHDAGEDKEIRGAAEARLAKDPLSPGWAARMLEKLGQPRSQHYARYRYEGIGASSTRSRYSRSIKLSMRFLIMLTSHLNCDDKTVMVSVSSCA
ncbi:hypothetical protein MRB53_041344 [Persea americana]|nr:hypothetical protein MRB53_041344 [Persea americana]